MLQYTYLTEVFPLYVDTRDLPGDTSYGFCPSYEAANYRDIHRVNTGVSVSTRLQMELSEVLTMKDNDKLRVVDGKLHIDNRRIKWFKRYWTKDSRWKVLEVLKKLINEYGLFYPELGLVVATLYETTYKKDKKWRLEMEKITGANLESALKTLRERTDTEQPLKDNKKTPPSDLIEIDDTPPSYSKQINSF